MKQFIHVSMPTGHVYEIPTRVIAEHRAAYYHKDFPEEFPSLEVALKDTEELFGDPMQIREWALNEMDWAEVKKRARLIRFTPPVNNWDEAEWSFHDVQPPISDIDEETLLEMPIEMVIASMAAAGQLAHVAVMHDATKEPFGMLALVQGQTPIVGLYINAMQAATNLATKMMEPPPADVPTH